MLTTINLKHIVWSACGHNQIPVIQVLPVLFPPVLKWNIPVLDSLFRIA